MKLLNVNLYELASEFIRKGLYRELLQGTTIGVSNVDMSSLGYNPYNFKPWAPYSTESTNQGRDLLEDAAEVRGLLELSEVVPFC